MSRIPTNPVSGQFPTYSPRHFPPGHLPPTTYYPYLMYALQSNEYIWTSVGMYVCKICIYVICMHICMNIHIDFPNPLTPLLGPAKTVAWPLTLTLPLLAICICFKHCAPAIMAHPLQNTWLGRVVHSGSLDKVVSALG